MDNDLSLYSFWRSISFKWV